MTYNVFGGMLNLTQSSLLSVHPFVTPAYCVKTVTILSDCFNTHWHHYSSFIKANGVKKSPTGLPHHHHHYHHHHYYHYQEFVVHRLHKIRTAVR